jgi:Amt family ammonium transporter
MTAVWLGLLSAAGVCVSMTALAVLVGRLSGTPTRWVPLTAAAVVSATIVVVAWLVGLTGVPAAFAAPLAALGAFFASAVTLRQRAGGDGLLRITLFSAILTIFVFVPAATVVWALWYDPFATGLGYLDLGAALPTEVATGSAVLAVLLLDRRRPVANLPPATGWAALWPALLMWAGWIGWLVGLELAIDRLTPTILANALLMPVAAALAVSLVERARHRANSFAGVAFGVLAGCAAATPAAGYVIPGIGVVVAVLVGAFSALLPRTPLPRIAGSLLVAGGTSLILLGLVAKDVSFIYTGQPEVLFTQALTVVAGALGAFAVAFAAWALLRRRGS